MKSKIAVTGASGHLGNVVCRLLIQQGYEVKAMYHKDSRSLEGLNLTRIQGDVMNQDDLSKLITGCEVVINCAAIISIRGDKDGSVFKTNTEGPRNVIEVSKRSGIKKVIHISSVHAVEETPTNVPYSENRPYKTQSAEAYDFSKATGEQIMLQQAGATFEVVVLRPSSVVGPFDFKPSEMGKALLDFYNEKIPALPEGGYNFVDVRDVANSIIESITSGRNGEIYLLSGSYYSLKNLSLLVKKITKKKVPQIVIPYKILRFALPLISIYSKLTGAAPVFTLAALDALRNGHPNMDHSKASKELGHNCRSMEQTLTDFYKWQHDQKIIA